MSIAIIKSASDIEASNGLVQAIDRVLLPIDAPNPEMDSFVFGKGDGPLSNFADLGMTISNRVENSLGSIRDFGNWFDDRFDDAFAGFGGPNWDF